MPETPGASKLRAALEAGEFVVTGEIAPPAGIDYQAMYRSVQILGPRTTAINVTDNQGASLRLSSLAASRVVLDLGYEPIFQQTCRDRNRLALQSDLLAGWTLGLRNVLMVTGDDPTSGDHPDARAVFDLDSTQLIRAARDMNEGRLLNGKELVGEMDFFIGAACFPEAEPWAIQLDRIQRKVDAGARFFQTQAVMDVEKVVERASAIRETGAYLIASVMLLKSLGVVRFINRNLSGVLVPEATEQRLADALYPEDEAVRIAVEQIEALRDHVDGIHIMALGLDDKVPTILARAGLEPETGIHL